MRTDWIKVVALSSCWAFAATAQGQRRLDSERSLADLAAEVMALRLELHKLELEQLQMAVAPLQSELEWVRHKRLKLAERDRKTKQQLALVEQTRGVLSDAERQDLEREAGGSERSTEPEKLLARQLELQRQIEFARLKWERISAAAKAVEAQLSAINRPAMPGR